VRHSLAIIEAAGTEALEETQRITGLLLSPDGAPLPAPRAGLADLTYLAEQVADAGLPVAIRVEGEPLPLTSDLDAAAYRVVHEALMSTLHHAQDARADVVVRYLPDELQVEVTDDGKPADDADGTQETAGLMAARDEVAAIGGTLDAGPRPGRGYWVMARLPYEPDWS
jgi:signal transduction histidine kinase